MGRERQEGPRLGLQPRFCRILLISQKKKKKKSPPGSEDSPGPPEWLMFNPGGPAFSGRLEQDNGDEPPWVGEQLPGLTRCPWM